MNERDEAYTGMTLQDIEMGLRMAGGVIESLKSKGKALEGKDEEFVLKFRAAATKYGLSKELQDQIEEEGAKIIRKAVNS